MHTAARRPDGFAPLSAALAVQSGAPAPVHCRIRRRHQLRQAASHENARLLAFLPCFLSFPCPVSFPSLLTFLIFFLYLFRPHSYRVSSTQLLRNAYSRTGIVQNYGRLAAAVSTKSNVPRRLAKTGHHIAFFCFLRPTFLYHERLSRIP
jgi:hypothetical protein